MPERASEDQAPPRIRWWLAGLLTICGVLVIALGYLLAHGFLIVDTTDQNYASGVAVNVGTSLLLAAALVLFERALVFTAERAVERATVPIRAEAAAARTESESVRRENVQLTQRTAMLEARLLDLDEQLQARANAEVREQERSFSTLAETVDRQTVLTILDDASAINALDRHSWSAQGGRIVVPAGEGLEAPRIAIEYAWFDEDNWNRDDIPTLRLAVVGMEGKYIAWDEQDSPLEIFAEIRKAMIGRGEARRVAPLSPTAYFVNLRKAVQQSIFSRSAHPEGWLTATPLLEMVTDDWMITQGGIEVRGHGIVIRPDHYPHNQPGHGRTDYRVGPSPEDLDSTIWDFAAERGKTYFTSPTADDPWSKHSSETPF